MNLFIIYYLYNIVLHSILLYLLFLGRSTENLFYGDYKISPDYSFSSYCQSGEFYSETNNRCSLCITGSYSISIGDIRIDQCSIVPAGHYSNSIIGATGYSPCPVGRYASVEGSVSCTPCKQGKFIIFNTFHYI